MIGDEHTHSLSALCEGCGGTGLYIGMAERKGVAVVCYRCDGTGETTLYYTPFAGRQPVPETVRSVHVARGYGLEEGHPLCDGGMPVEAWSPGAVVPADEKLYCPFSYTNQEWCARPDEDGYPPMLLGLTIDRCPYWGEKADCWVKYHADSAAPEVTR